MPVKMIIDKSGVVEQPSQRVGRQRNAIHLRIQGDNEGLRPPQRTPLPFFTGPKRAKNEDRGQRDGAERPHGTAIARTERFQPPFEHAFKVAQYRQDARTQPSLRGRPAAAILGSE